MGAGGSIAVRHGELRGGSTKDSVRSDATHDGPTPELWLSDQVLASLGTDLQTEEGIYAGESTLLNDGVLGYDQITKELAESGDPSAQMAVVASRWTTDVFRRDAALTMSFEHLEAVAPRRCSPTTTTCYC